jgi:hypothetical protein
MRNACGNRGFIVDMKREIKKDQLPKVRVKVSKAAFDKVLGRLIKAEPQKRSN